MQEWSDGVRLAIDVMVASVIVVCLLVCGQLSSTIMNTMDNERAAAGAMQEYRIQRMYDNADCYPQDIVSIIMEYQGNPTVYVTPKSGAVMTWSTTSRKTAISSNAISLVLNQKAMYRCTLTYDRSGTLIAYNFREV